MRFRPASYVFLAAAVALAGCSPAAQEALTPSWMPTDYAHTNDLYKSGPGPAAPSIGYPYTAVDNAAAVQHWEWVAERLVHEMHSQLGLTGQPVYLSMLPDENAFNASFDFAFRDVLRKHGYTLVTNDRNVLKLDPEVLRENPWREQNEVTAYNGDDKGSSIEHIVPKHHPFFVLGAVASRNGIPVGEVRDDFHPPRYGYVGGTGTSAWQKFYGENAAHEGPAGDMIPGPCTDKSGTGPQPCATTPPGAPINVLSATPAPVTQENLNK